MPSWVWAAAAVCIAGIGGAFLLNRKAEPPAAPAKPVAEKPSAPAPAAPSANSIAVLPFTNMSEEKDSAFFSDGMHEEVLTNLAFIRDLRVVSRTSVMQYRGTTKPIGQIAAELKVAYILEGSVRRAGNRVRVTGQLIRAATDEHVWAKNYDGDLTDVFALQGELAKAIAGALQAVISPEASSLLDRRHTANPIAHDFFLRARNAWHSVSQVASVQIRQLAEIEKLLESAVQQDPAFALAWASLANTHGRFVSNGIDSSPARVAKGEAALAKALQLAPEAPEVIRAAGTFAYFARRDYGQAIELLSKAALQLPNDAEVLFALGSIHRRQGKWSEALAGLRRAVELEPANILFVSNQAMLYQRARRWEEMIAGYQRVAELSPASLHDQLIVSYRRYTTTGSPAPLAEAIARLTPEQRESPVGRFWRRALAQFQGNYAEFKRLDGLHPVLDQVEEPADTALRACYYFIAQGEKHRVPARLGELPGRLRASLATDPKNRQLRARLAQIEAVNGDPQEAVRLARELVAEFPVARDHVVGPELLQTPLAVVLAVTGDREGAIAALLEYLALPVQGTVFTIRDNPAFANLRGDPRFEALVNDPKYRQPLF